ncbi:MAG: hypothetical protein HYR95_00405 [Candidatus Colwellbacteria bacterium]|nr:hypothetical protein [Candidatus Colwellbacteria bacterium]MBI3274293.1 hypothetical protein [Candidatus Colwellbacteria bacterium]
MKYSLLIFLALVFSNVFVWNQIVSAGPSKNLNMYLLDVGQGDSQLLVLPAGPKILIDGGPEKAILKSLPKVLSPIDRYIDLIILSHPQLDHFSGLISVIERYQVGAFIYNGREGITPAWKDLLAVLKKRNVRVIVLGEGSTLTYEESKIDFISPNKDFLKSKELNDTAFVELFQSEGVRAMFTGDIGLNVEQELLKKYNLDIDILKVAHHGSKYSTGNEFLAAATPRVSVIQVGKNKYGHPTKEALGRLAQSGSAVYRNDQDGTVRLKIKNGVINVSKEK